MNNESKDVTIKISKSTIRTFLMLVAFILVIAVLTNPKVDLHKAIIRNEVHTRLENFVDKNINSKKAWIETLLGIGTSVGLAYVDQKVTDATHIEDYIFFSVTKLQIKDQSVAVGVGAFGQIWLFTDVLNTMDLSHFVY